MEKENILWWVKYYVMYPAMWVEYNGKRMVKELKRLHKKYRLQPSDAELHQMYVEMRKGWMTSSEVTGKYLKTMENNYIYEAQERLTDIETEHLREENEHLRQGFHSIVYLKYRIKEALKKETLEEIKKELENILSKQF